MTDRRSNPRPVARARRRSPTPIRISDPQHTRPLTVADGTANSAGAVVDRLLTVREAADFLRLSTSWLAKARMRGDGPPFVKLGGSIRYLESTLVRWMRAQQRLSIGDR
jgi:predicted DNA-binding transcriptional regulator AlpA